MATDPAVGFFQDKALITAATAVGLWLLTRWIEFGANYVRSRKERTNLIRSLFAEVDFNTKDLDFFVQNSADISAIEARLNQSEKYLPHITDAHHTIIYASSIPKLHYLDDTLASRLVLFYGLLEKIKAQIDGINLSSFVATSAAGKITVVKRVIVNVTECEAEGSKILDAFSTAYPKLKLTRHFRKNVDTKQR